MTLILVQELEKFLRGDLPAEESRRIVRELLAACRENEPQPMPAIGKERMYNRAFEEQTELLTERAAAIAVERERAPELAAGLLAIPAAERKAAVRTDRAYQDWALCVWLIDECRQQTYVDTSGAQELADLAVAVAEELDTRHLGELLVNDLRARAWAAVGEVLRTISDLRGADEVLLLAEDLVANGSGDALEEAQILELKAALRRDQRRFSEAHSLLDEVSLIYRQYRDFHLVGRAFVQKGRVCGAEDDLEGAVEWLRKGVALVDPVRDQRFVLSARHSLMLSLHESGRHQEAWFMLKASRPEFVAHGGEILCLRLRWLEGKIQRSLGRLDEAETALVEARDGLIEQEIGFDAALVSLDLADLYASQERGAKMRELAEEMLPIFRSRDVHREAMAALIVFQQAARMEEVNPNLLQEIASYLERARHDHGLRFEPS